MSRALYPLQPAVFLILIWKNMLDGSGKNSQTGPSTFIPSGMIFLGSVFTVSGLITDKRLIAQLKDKNLGEYLLLPINMFRIGETVFLDDLTAEDVEKALQVKIRIVKSDGQDFVHAILDPSSEPEPEPKEEGLPGEEYGYEGYELDEIWEDEDEYIEDDETESER